MRCDVCGFDLELWNHQDLERTLLSASYLVEMADAEGAADDLPREGVFPEAVHTLLHRLHLAGRERHAGAASQTGVVAQLSRSGGGVPKRPVPQARISRRGLEGDQQADRRHHGRPWQAVCLWSAEVVDALGAAGHPIRYGSAGENVSVRGLDWGRVTPGARLSVGEALLEVSAYAIPCDNNAQWFSDGDFQRMSHERDPAGSRVYASVVREGVVREGDAVVLEP